MERVTPARRLRLSTQTKLVATVGVNPSIRKVQASMQLCRDSDKRRLEEATDELFQGLEIARQIVRSLAHRPEVAGPFLRSRHRRALHLTPVFS